MQTNKQSFEMPSEEMKFQELISWSVWEEYSSAPITGWMSEMHCAIPYLKNSKLDKKLAEKAIPSFQEIVESNGSQIALE